MLQHSSVQYSTCTLSSSSSGLATPPWKMGIVNTFFLSWVSLVTLSIFSLSRVSRVPLSILYLCISNDHIFYSTITNISDFSLPWLDHVLHTPVWSAMLHCCNLDLTLQLRSHAITQVSCHKLDLMPNPNPGCMSWEICTGNGVLFQSFFASWHKVTRCHGSELLRSN